MYAIIQAKGKQFRAEPDETLRLPSLDAAPGERVTFDEVLLAQRDGEVIVGRPALDGASVKAEVVRHGKDDKIVVYKMKRRKGYRRKQGHRQKFTEVRVVSIDLGTGKPAAKKARKPAAGPAAKVETPARKPETPAPKPAAEAKAVEATPAAAALAEEHGIDLSTIEGSGKEGRILKGDVEKAIKAQGGA
ncbi:MAG: 50S ribosomal protein L21 [Gemmatimonadota bacterium]